MISSARADVSAIEALAAQLAVAPTRGLARTKQALHESWERPLAAQLDLAARDARDVEEIVDEPDQVPNLTRHQSARALNV